MKKVILTEEQIKYLIEEERGIAKKVVELTNKIERTIQSINPNPFQSYQFKIDDLLINFMLTSFKTLNDGYKWYLENKRNDGYSFDENCLYLTLIYVNNECNYSDFRNTIQHEVEHYWQCKNVGKKINNNRYNIITKESLYSDNPIISYICKLLYYSFEFEIDAYVNGAYNEAIKSNQIYNNYKDYIYNTGLKDIYTILKNSAQNLEKYSIENLYFLSSINYLKSVGVFSKTLTPQQIIKKIEKKTNESFNYLIKQIGKTFSLYIENINMTNEQISIGKNFSHLKKLDF